MDDWYWIRAVMFKGAWLSASGDVAEGRCGTWKTCAALEKKYINGVCRYYSI